MVMAERMKREIAELRKNLYDMEARIKGLVGVRQPTITKLSDLSFDTINNFNVVDLVVDTTNFGKVLRIGEYILWHNPDLGVNELHIHHYDGEMKDIISLSRDKVDIYRTFIGRDVYVENLRFRNTNAYIGYDPVNKVLTLNDGDIHKIIPTQIIHEVLKFNMYSLNYDGVIPYFYYTNSTSPQPLTYAMLNKTSIKQRIGEMYDTFKIKRAWVYIIGGTDYSDNYVNFEIRKQPYGDILDSIRTNNTLSGMVFKLDITDDFELGDESNYTIHAWSENENYYAIILNAWLEVVIEVIRHD